MCDSSEGDLVISISEIFSTSICGMDKFAQRPVLLRSFSFVINLESARSEFLLKLLKCDNKKSINQVFNQIYLQIRSLSKQF